VDDYGVNAFSDKSQHIITHDLSGIEVCRMVSGRMESVDTNWNTDGEGSTLGLVI